jgi:serine/threonine-protein kinase
MHRDALAMRRRLLGPSHPDVAQSLSDLGITLWFQASIYGRKAARVEAEPLLREAVAIYRKALGNESLELAAPLCILSLTLQSLKKAPEAELAAREGLSICRKLYGENHPAIGDLSDSLGAALERQNKYEEAEAAYRQGMAARQRILGAEHSALRFSFTSLGNLFRKQGRLPEAEAMFRQLLRMSPQFLRPDMQVVYGERLAAHAVSCLADVLRGQGKLTEAASVWREGAERGLDQSLNEAAWFLATSPDAAIRNPLEAIVYAEKAVAATSRTNAGYLDTLATAYASSGQFTNAVCTQQEAIALLRDEQSIGDFASRLRLYEAGQPYHDDGELAARGSYLLTQGKLPEAEKLLRDCLTLREKQIPDDWRRFNSMSMLGGALLEQKKFSEAEPYLLGGYQGMQEREAKIPPGSKARLKETLQRLVQLYDAQGHPDQAGKWKQQLEEFERTQTDLTAPNPSPKQ